MTIHVTLRFAGYQRKELSYSSGVRPENATARHSFLATLWAVRHAMLLLCRLWFLASIQIFLGAADRNLSPPEASLILFVNAERFSRGFIQPLYVNDDLVLAAQGLLTGFSSALVSSTFPLSRPDFLSRSIL